MNIHDTQEARHEAQIAGNDDAMDRYFANQCKVCEEQMETVDGVTRCAERDCWPDCAACKGKGYIGFGYSCDTCQGLGRIGYTQSEIDNEHERRGVEQQESDMAMGYDTGWHLENRREIL